MKSLTIAIVPMCAALLCAQDRPKTQTEIKQTETTITVQQGAPDAAFDVRHKDDRGKLVVSSKGVTFENISDGKKSKTWAYSQIRELKREGKEIEIKPYDGDEMEFMVEGSDMSDAVYKVIADRIVAARAGR